MILAEESVCLFPSEGIATTQLLGPSWSYLWTLLGHRWSTSRPSWNHLGPSWVLLGAFLGPLGSWLFVLCSEVLLVMRNTSHVEAFCCHLETIFGLSWATLEPPQGPLGAISGLTGSREPYSQDLARLKQWSLLVHTDSYIQDRLYRLAHVLGCPPSHMHILT